MTVCHRKYLATILLTALLSLGAGYALSGWCRKRPPSYNDTVEVVHSALLNRKPCASPRQESWKRFGIFGTVARLVFFYPERYGYEYSDEWVLRAVRELTYCMFKECEESGMDDSEGARRIFDIYVATLSTEPSKENDMDIAVLATFVNTYSDAHPDVAARYLASLKECPEKRWLVDKLAGIKHRFKRTEKESGP